ncbi:hypothetical protein CAPTEDRAFT_204538 [Capitella teleta]|uniref:Uncharacterized protein n=1 Tax=Capitella teleta TaxID=283909 RepID=R7TGN8_CAPTE|nr:hypothetical protein CAPTEDRAFT_204538 [Capitella teleta]|eukprot:ELT92963.1 hypothetical protein CAPTEDRAFT_204538 [Capitella teleta]
MGGVITNMCSCVPISIVDCPVLEYLSAFALTASYIREASESTLLKACHFIPFFIFLPSILVTVKPKLRSLRSYAIFRGLSVGFVCGCMSFIVDTQDQTGYLFYSGPGSASSALHVRLIWYTEMLHAPVLLACLLWTVIHLCEQSSCLSYIPLAVGGAIFAELVILLSLATLGRLQTSAEEAKTFITLFVIIFLVAMIPCLQSQQRSVIVVWLCIFLNFFWQTSKWDKNVWNWSTVRFPVPGGIAGYMLVMLTSEPKASGCCDRTPDCFKCASRHRLKTTQVKLQLQRIFWRLEKYHMFLTFVVAFCVMRVYLSVAQNPYYPEDRIMSCVILLTAYATVQLPQLERLFTSCSLLLMGLCQLLFYLTWTFAQRAPLNCYAVDSILGLLLVFSVRKALVLQEKNSDSRRSNILSA